MPTVPLLGAGETPAASYAHTVERRRQNVMAKLGLHSRAELIKYATRKGLIEADS